MGRGWVRGGGGGAHMPKSGSPGVRHLAAGSAPLLDVAARWPEHAAAAAAVDAAAAAAVDAARSHRGLQGWIRKGSAGREGASEWLGWDLSTSAMQRDCVSSK